jgi:hypothetical protein
MGRLRAQSLMPFRGHGTYVENDQVISSVTGTIERVNKLISVKPLKSRWVGFCVSTVSLLDDLVVIMVYYQKYPPPLVPHIARRGIPTLFSVPVTIPVRD